MLLPHRMAMIVTQREIEEVVTGVGVVSVIVIVTDATIAIVRGSVTADVRVIVIVNDLVTDPIVRGIVHGIDMMSAIDVMIVIAFLLHLPQPTPMPHTCNTTPLQQATLPMVVCRRMQPLPMVLLLMLHMVPTHDIHLQQAMEVHMEEQVDMAIEHREEHPYYLEEKIFVIIVISVDIGRRIVPDQRTQVNATCVANMGMLNVIAPIILVVLLVQVWVWAWVQVDMDKVQLVVLVLSVLVVSRRVGVDHDRGADHDRDHHCHHDHPHDHDQGRHVGKEMMLKKCIMKDEASSREVFFFCNVSTYYPLTIPTIYCNINWPSFISMGSHHALHSPQHTDLTLADAYLLS